MDPSKSHTRQEYRSAETKHHHEGSHHDKHHHDKHHHHEKSHHKGGSHKKEYVVTLVSDGEGRMCLGVRRVDENDVYAAGRINLRIGSVYSFRAEARFMFSYNSFGGNVTDRGMPPLPISGTRIVEVGEVYQLTVTAEMVARGNNFFYVCPDVAGRGGKVVVYA